MLLLLLFYGSDPWMRSQESLCIKKMTWMILPGYFVVECMVLCRPTKGRQVSSLPLGFNSICFIITGDNNFTFVLNLLTLEFPDMFNHSVCHWKQRLVYVCVGVGPGLWNLDRVGGRPSHARYSFSWCRWGLTHSRMHFHYQCSGISACLFCWALGEKTWKELPRSFSPLPGRGVCPPDDDYVGQSSC